MFQARLIVALILIGAGAYFAWEAHSILNMEAFEVRVELVPDAPLTSEDLNAINSPAADLSEKLGADTYAELDNYLSIMRIEGIVAVIAGFVLIATRKVKQASNKTRAKSKR